MQKTKRKNDSTPQRAKTIAVFRRDDDSVYMMMVFVLVMFGCGYLVMLPTVIKLFDFSAFWAVLILLVILMPVYIPFTRVFTDRLEVTAVGLRWWRFGIIKKVVGWDGLTGFGTEERIGKYGRRYHVGVIYAYGGNIPVTTYIKVPGGIFNSNESALKDFQKYNALGQYLAEYAPHLFEHLESES